LSLPPPQPTSTSHETTSARTTVLMSGKPHRPVPARGVSKMMGYVSGSHLVSV
jgi:hypothetical protein